MEWLETPYLYLYLMLFSMAYPIAQSFERRLRYYRNWPGLFAGIALMMVLFLPWDIWFTHEGVWWFNDRYITGVKLWLLPLEEWLFFLIVPFACVFIHDVLRHYVKRDLLFPIARPFFIGLGVILLVFSVIFHDQLYTFVTFGLTGIALLFAAWRNPLWRGRFLMTYLVCWLPFLLINGALTGNFTQEAVVNYSPEAIIGLRITTIPLEDSIYNLLMLLVVISVYEAKRERNV